MLVHTTRYFHFHSKLKKKNLAQSPCKTVYYEAKSVINAIYNFGPSKLKTTFMNSSIKLCLIFLGTKIQCQGRGLQRCIGQTVFEIKLKKVKDDNASYVRMSLKGPSKAEGRKVCQFR